MLERHARATFIVDRDSANGFSLEGSPRNDRGHLLFRQISQELDVCDQPVGDDDERFDAAIEKHFEIAFETMRLVMSVSEQGKIIRLIQRILDAAEDRRAEWVGDVEDHYADNVGTLAAQRTREGVRAITQAAGGGYDARFRVRGNIAREGSVVQHNGDGGGRIAALPGYVADGDDAASRHFVCLTFAPDSCNVSCPACDRSENAC